jgi:hypothetical protein
MEGDFALKHRNGNVRKPKPGENVRYEQQNKRKRPPKATQSMPTKRDDGGGTGIRTLGGLSPSSVFKTGAFDHSATPPTGTL